jgi:hypothetical protein
MKKALFALIFSLTVAAPAFANGVERGAEFPFPAPILTPLFHQMLSAELSRSCDFTNAHLALANAVFQGSDATGERLLYTITLEVSPGISQATDTVAVSATVEPAHGGHTEIAPIVAPGCRPTIR